VGPTPFSLKMGSRKGNIAGVGLSVFKLCSKLEIVVAFAIFLKRHELVSQI
jgi:hypothetical protein